MRADELDAVTIDALGTVVALADPVPALRAALAARGVERDAETVARAFQSEVAHYVPRAHLGRDPGSLAALQRECTGVFLDAARASIPAAEFMDAFLGSLRFRALPGVAAALARLRRAGLALACVSNWDATLADHLGRAGLRDSFDAVVSSAAAGAPKPAPAVFSLALAALAVAPERALHVGDDEADRTGALAAGMAYAPPPVVTLPARLGLEG